MTWRVFYMCHPVAGDVAANLERAKRWIRWLHDAIPDGVVIAPWILDLETLPLRDVVPADRERGLQRCTAVARRCTGMLLVGGRITAGMQREALEAYYAGIGVFDLTSFGEEPGAVPIGQALLVGRDWSPSQGGSR